MPGLFSALLRSPLIFDRIYPVEHTLRSFFFIGGDAAPLFSLRLSLGDDIDFVFLPGQDVSFRNFSRLLCTLLPAFFSQVKGKPRLPERRLRCSSGLTSPLLRREIRPEMASLFSPSQVKSFFQRLGIAAFSPSALAMPFS